MADWRKDLEKAYQKGANWAVKDSNKTFDKTISDTGRDALTRGLGRSSYTTQTLANLQTDKNEAGNRIKSEFELEFLKAKQQRELEEEQRELERQKLEEEKRQFDLQMAANAAATGGGGGYSGNRNPGTQTPQTTQTPQNSQYPNLRDFIFSGDSQTINHTPIYYGPGDPRNAPYMNQKNAGTKR